METKSRYEVIASLEEEKRKFIRDKDSFDEQIKSKEKEIKMTKRQLEDENEELKEFKDSVEDKKLTITELIKAVDDSLKRLSNLSQSQKK